MFPGRSVPLTDQADLRFRLATVKTGCWLTFLIALAGLGYLAVTWDQGNREILSLIAGATAVSGPAVLLLPMDRVIASRWRETFFLGWTASMVVVVETLVLLDPANPSPLALPLLMPLLFAGMSYPRELAWAVGVTVPVSYVGVAFVDGQDPAYAAFFVLCLTWTAAMCLWQAGNREKQRAELDRQRDELARVSRADPLTEALNRRGFEERFESELAHAARSGLPLTLVELDLDNFKQVNDEGGHAAGDALLCSVVERLGETLRPLDAVGRMGGDEFAILLPGVGVADAPPLVERIAESVATVARTSVGLACFPGDGTTADELHRHADEALYAAKGARPPRPALEPVDLSWAAALADAVDRRMDIGHEHSRVVAEYAAGIAERLGWPEEQVGLLRLAATLHDVGKVAIPDRILQKAGPLDPDEYEEIKRHSLVGAEMVARIPGMEPVVPWIRHSHEHVDGSGYPDGLTGDAIPLASRVLLVADAFDAMTSDRSYRRAMPAERALDELRRNAGRQFDADCVEVLVELSSEGALTPGP